MFHNFLEVEPKVDMIELIKNILVIFLNILFTEKLFHLNKY
jgi:hypothetical protein